MPPRPQVVAQLALDERQLTDPGLEQALEERQQRKEIYDEARQLYDQKAKVAEAEIAKLELPDGTAVRVGRFRIARQTVPGGHREFDTRASSRVRISLLDEG